jgi:hypothetical protein
MVELSLAALDSDPLNRPSLEDFENRLWDELVQLDGDTHTALKLQVEHIESMTLVDDEWPHMDERLMQLRQFYSGF